MYTDYKIDRWKFFSEKEKNKLLRIAKERSELDRMHGRIRWIKRWMLIDLLMRSGLRIMEVQRLQHGDLILKKDDRYIRVKKGKGERPRDVYITPKLTNHLRQFIQDKITWGELTGEFDPLFGRWKDEVYRPYGKTALQYSFKQAVKTSGLRESLTVHSCRHTYAIWFYRETKDLHKLKRQMGHANINMSSLYLDAEPNEMNETVKNLD